MHFFTTSTVVLLSTCLAQVIANPAGAQIYSNDDSTGIQPNGVGDNQGNGSGDGQGQGGQNGQGSQGIGQANNRNGTDGVPHHNKHQGQGNGQIKEVGNNQGQVTVTVTAAASTAQPLTVMTVTVTAPCSAGANANANAVSTSVIAAPTASPSDSEATPARQFVTAASDIKPGLTSLPVAVASALGNSGNAPPAAGSTSSQSVSPGNFATVSSGFAGKTFTTTGTFVPGVVTSIPVADAIPSFV